jgi:signal transduction histidine kinase
MPSDVLDEEAFGLASLPPSPFQKRLALVLVTALSITFLLTAGPLAHFQPGRIAAFVPAYVTAMFLSEMTTAILLFSQFSILRTRSLLVMATGYYFTALMVIPWLLTFPGVFKATGVIGGLQTRPFIYFFWHAGFPIFVICYALLKDDYRPGPRWVGKVGSGVGLSIAITTAVVAAAAILFSFGNSLLPNVQVDLVHVGPQFLYLGVPTSVLILAAFIILFVRRRSVLDYWLMLVMCAYQIEICLDYYPFPGIFSFGWYASRIFGLFSSSLVLLMLLSEIMALYAQLFSAVRAQRREREARLMTGDAIAAAIAHEVKQPLAGMITSAEAGLRFLAHPEPNFGELTDALKQIAADGHRAGAVIGGLREMFRPDTRERISLDLNQLIEETLILVRAELSKHRIHLETKLDEDLPKVIGNRVQLQQVLINLVSNSIDAMAPVNRLRILTVKSEIDGAGKAKVSVADTGNGVSSEYIDRIFTPLFTTKSDGMGMGLAICRSIIESHDGQLWALPNSPKGSVFCFTSACLSDA